MHLKKRTDLHQTVKLQTSETVPLSKFLPEALAISDIISPAIAEQRILESARRLATDTYILKRKVELNIQPGVQTYPAHLKGYEFIRFTSHPECCNTGCDSEVARDGQSTCCWPYRNEQRSDIYYDEVSNQFILRDCKECKPYSVCFGVIVKPDMASCEIDDLFYNKYYEAMRHLIVYNLLIMPNVPWSDRQLASDNLRLYQSVANEISTRRILAHSGATIKIKPKRMV